MGRMSLKLGALLRKYFRYALTNLDNELLPLPGSLSRVINKTSLNSIPAYAKIFCHIRQEERANLLLFTPYSGVLISHHWLFAISIDLLFCIWHLRSGC